MADPRRCGTGLVVVTGLPGSGKSTVGSGLAAVLGWRFVSLDSLKESLHERTRGALSGLELRLAAEGAVAEELRGPEDLVLDVWVQPGRDDERVQALLATGGRRVAEVHCRVPAEVAVHRYVARRRGGPHAASDDAAVLARIRDAAAVIGPLGVGAAIEVDTTAPWDAESLAGRVREALEQG